MHSKPLLNSIDILTMLLPSYSHWHPYTHCWWKKSFPVTQVVPHVTETFSKTSARVKKTASALLPSIVSCTSSTNMSETACLEHHAWLCVSHLILIKWFWALLGSILPSICWYNRTETTLLMSSCNLHLLALCHRNARSVLRGEGILHVDKKYQFN